MKRATFSLVARIFLAAAGQPQDLPPGALLMSRVKKHIAEELDRLPNITCQEFVRRDHQPAGGKRELVDTVRLEVLSSGGKELFSSPGDAEFSEGGWLTYVGSGTFGNGIFGNYLKQILMSGRASYRYKGEEDFEKHRVARYDYQVPLLSSMQTITIPGVSAKVSLRGSYWVDTQSYDVVRIELTAGDIPSTLRVQELAMSVNYRRTRLRDDTGTLLPESAELRMVKSSGEIDFNGIEFANCREFKSRSAIKFQTAEPTGKGISVDPVKTDGNLSALPDGMEVTVRLTSPISEDTAVGTMIDGVVAGNVPAKGNVAIPTNLTVRGRVRRLERYHDPVPHFIVALEFTEIDIQGTRYRFDADLVDIQEGRGVQETLVVAKGVEILDTVDGGSGTNRTLESLSVTKEPGVATFFVKGSKLNLHRGFHTKWRTRVATK